MLTEPLTEDPNVEEEKAGQQIAYAQGSINSTAHTQAIFAHSDSDDDDNGGAESADENTIASKSAIIISQIISRHYGLLFVCMVFCASIGFIIYLFTSYSFWVYLFAFIGLVIGIIIDHKIFSAQKNIYIKTKYELTQDEIQLVDQNWRSAENDFYVQSNFYSRFQNKYRGSSYVYHKKDSGALVFEKKAFKRVESYNGFEIGGGIASFIGSILSVIVTIVSDISKTSAFLALLFILFLIIVFGLMGCIMERELRKWNYIPPINQVLVKRDSIALHDISHICCVTYGYHLHHAGVTSASWVERLAIYWFKLVAGIFYIIYLILQFLCYVFWVNSAFTLWLFVTVSLVFLFDLQITKSDTDTLDSAMWCVIASCLLSMLCALFVSSFYRKEVKIGSLTIQQLKHQRLDEKQQKTLFVIFLICILFLTIASIMVTYVAGDVHNISDKYFHVNLYKSDVWDKMVCKSQRNTAFPFGSDNQLLVEDELEDVLEDKLCKSLNYEFLAVSLLLLCILWYMLLGAACWWNHFDKYQFSMEGKKTPRKWVQYSYMYVHRKSAASWMHMGIFTQTYCIELTDKDAKSLQDYLNDECPWYTKPKFVAIHPHSLEFVQAFETIKPVHDV